MALRYSLRWFWGSAVVIATALGLWARRSHEQTRLVRRAELAQFQLEYGSLVRTAPHFMPQALARVELVLGKDWVFVPVAAKANSTCEYPEDFCDLCALRTLRSIDLRGTATDDGALSMIAGLKCLTVLKLRSTRITDVGLSTLDRCNSLRELEVDLTLVTPDAVKSFQARNPLCKVSYSHSSQPEDFEYLRFTTLNANRNPTAEEKNRFDLAVRLIEERDKHRQYELSHELFHPGEPLPIPNPGYHNQRNHESWIKNQPDSDYHEVAAKVLGDLGLAGGIPYVERVARNTTDYKWVRPRVVRSLSHIADRRVIPVLIDLLDDRSSEVAAVASNALVSLTSLPPHSDLNPESPSYDRHNLSDRWKRYWQENGEFIRLRRARTFSP
jgi:hypothetical protein